MFDPTAPLRHINLLSVLLMRLIAALWPRAMRGPPPAPVRWCLARYIAHLAAGIRISLIDAGYAAPAMSDEDLVRWFAKNPLGFASLPGTGRVSAQPTGGVRPTNAASPVMLRMTPSPQGGEGGAFMGKVALKARGPPCPIGSGGALAAAFANGDGDIAAS